MRGTRAAAAWSAYRPPRAARRAPPSTDRVRLSVPGWRDGAAPAARTDPARTWRKPTPKRVRAIRDRLRLVYGIPNSTPDCHPIAELILTVLSQSTNDRNRDVAYFGLRDRFEDWEAIRDAPVDQAEEAIRPGGISKVKSARIKTILRTITDTPCPRAGHRVGELSLDWLPRLFVPHVPGISVPLSAAARP